MRYVQPRTEATRSSSQFTFAVNERIHPFKCCIFDRTIRLFCSADYHSQTALSKSKAKWNRTRKYIIYLTAFFGNYSLSLAMIFSAYIFKPYLYTYCLYALNALCWAGFIKTVIFYDWVVTLTMISFIGVNWILVDDENVVDSIWAHSCGTNGQTR